MCVLILLVHSTLIVLAGYRSSQPFHLSFHPRMTTRCPRKHSRHTMSDTATREMQAVNDTSAGPHSRPNVGYSTGRRTSPLLTRYQEFTQHAETFRRRHRNARKPSDASLPRRRPAPPHDAAPEESPRLWPAVAWPTDDILMDQTIIHDHQRFAAQGSRVEQDLASIVAFTRTLRPIQSAPATFVERFYGTTEPWDGGLTACEELMQRGSAAAKLDLRRTRSEPAATYTQKGKPRRRCASSETDKIGTAPDVRSLEVEAEHSLR